MTKSLLQVIGYKMHVFLHKKIAGKKPSITIITISFLFYFFFAKYFLIKNCFYYKKYDGKFKYTSLFFFSLSGPKGPHP